MYLRRLRRFFLNSDEYSQLKDFSIDGNSFASKILIQNPQAPLSELINLILREAFDQLRASKYG